MDRNKKFIIIAFVLLLIGMGLYFLSQMSPKQQEQPAPSPADEVTPPSQPDQTSNSQMLDNGKEEQVDSQDVVYFEKVKGLLVKPKEVGNYPGVVMIHEWWGLNDQIRDTAKNLSSEGYVVLAVDLFNGSVATTQDQARQQTSSLDQVKALENLKAAVSYLKNNQKVTKVASLGWCFGGGQSMQLAVNDGPLDATVIYYGNLVTEKDKLTGIKWPVLGVFGDKDQSISVESVNQFDNALDELNVENEIYIYPGVGHAFANPSGANYAPNETKDAWNKTLLFLSENLKN